MTAKARILFIDDEKRVLNAMRGLFRREYDLFLTSDGAEAINLVQAHDIDVIVADQRMPGMTGIEVLGKVKERSPRTVRVLLTGYADPSAVEGSINIGEVFRFLSKPCPPQMLRETLALAVSAAQTAPVSVPVQPAMKPASADSRLVPTSEAQPVSERAPVPVVSKPPEGPVTQPEMTLTSSDDTEPALPVLDETAMRHRESNAHWETVTNVVMAEDSVEETVETIGLGANSSRIKHIPVVVFTIDSEFASTAIRALSSDRNLIIATTLVKVADAITEQGAGVLVTDFTSNGAMLQKMVGALKKRMPELVTIVVSNGRDTTDMINLINYGQIFRYVLKPLEPEQLRNDINAAVIHHLYLLSNPESAVRHEVIDSSDSVDSSKSLNRFLGKFRKAGRPGIDPADTIA